MNKSIFKKIFHEIKVKVCYADQNMLGVIFAAIEDETDLVKGYTIYAFDKESRSNCVVGSLRCHSLDPITATRRTKQHVKLNIPFRVYRVVERIKVAIERSAEELDRSNGRPTRDMLAYRQTAFVLADGAGCKLLWLADKPILLDAEKEENYSVLLYGESENGMLG